MAITVIGTSMIIGWSNRVMVVVIGDDDSYLRW